MTKGRKTEEIIKNYLVSCNYKVFPVLTKEGQIKQGDLIVYSPIISKVQTATKVGCIVMRIPLH